MAPFQANPLPAAAIVRLGRAGVNGGASKALDAALESHQARGDMSDAGLAFLIVLASLHGVGWLGMLLWMKFGDVEQGPGRLGRLPVWLWPFLPFMILAFPSVIGMAGLVIFVGLVVVGIPWGLWQLLKEFGWPYPR